MDAKPSPVTKQVLQSQVSAQPLVEGLRWPFVSRTGSSQPRDDLQVKWARAAMMMPIITVMIAAKHFHNQRVVVHNRRVLCVSCNLERFKLDLIHWHFGDSQNSVEGREESGWNLSKLGLLLWAFWSKQPFFFFLKDNLGKFERRDDDTIWHN